MKTVPWECKADDLGKAGPAKSLGRRRSVLLSLLTIMVMVVVMQTVFSALKGNEDGAGQEGAVVISMRTGMAGLDDPDGPASEEEELQAPQQDPNAPRHDRGFSKMSDDARQLLKLGSLEAIEAEIGAVSRNNKTAGGERDWAAQEQRIRDLKVWTNPAPAGCARVEPIERIPTIVVVSNRRSGTHMTMDMLANAFPQDKNVIKANHVRAVSEDMTCECMNWLRHNVKVMHTHRNVLDVVVSMYHYRRGYDRAFHDSVTWKQFLRSRWLNQILDHWCKTVHSWFLLDDVLSVKFSDTVQMKPEMLDDIAAFLGLHWRDADLGVEGREAKVLDRTQWEIVSHPVHKGRGKGAGGFAAMMTEDVERRILEKVRRNPVWKKDKLLKCEAKPFKHDELCVAEDGKKTLIRNEGSCILIGTTKGKPIHGHKQSYVCIPRSCPHDLIRGWVITNFEGKQYANIHKEGNYKGFRK